MTDLFRRYWPDEKPEYDWDRIGAGFSKCFYYNAWPHQKSGQSDDHYAAVLQAHDDLIEQISASDNWHAYAGEARHRHRAGLEQKMVDVMIAVDMMRHTHKGNMARCTLLTSDLDFKPLLDALVQEGMHVTLWHGNNANRALKRAADNRQPLNSMSLRNILTPASIHRLRPPEASVGPPDLQHNVVHEAGELRPGAQWRYMQDTRDGRHILAWEVSTPGAADTWLSVTSMSLEHALLYAEDAYGVGLAVQAQQPANE